MKNCELHSMGGLNPDIVQKILYEDIVTLNHNNLESIMGVITVHPQSYLRKHIAFCRKCISSGFLSILHQFVLIHKCPFHNIDLDFCCPKCRSQKLYRLSDEFFKNPFECKCGHEFLKKASNYSTLWGSAIPKIKSQAVKSWLSLSQTERETIKNMLLFTDIDFEEYPGIMEHILSAMDSSYKSSRNEIHVITESTHNVRKYGNYLEEYNQVRSSDSERQYIKFLKKVEDEIYWSTVGTFNSITKQIKKELMQKHMSCIRRTRGDEFYCPYAFAFVHWRKFIENIKYCWQVENRYLPKRPRADYDIMFSSFQDYQELRNVLSEWSSGRNRQYESMAATKWIINKVLGQLLLNHF